MTLHALDVLGDAVTATREYRPRGLGQWLWVAFVVLLVGSPAIGLPTGGGTGGGREQLTQAQRADLSSEVPGQVPPDVLAAIGLIVAVLVVVWALFVLLGAVLEFPFLAWLRDGEVATWSNVRAHLGQGLGLAAFRLVIGSIGLAVLVGLVLATVGTSGTALEYVLAAADFAVLFAVVGFLTGIVTSFTTAFVVPTMMLEDTGVLGGWRRFWNTLTGAPKQFLVYAVAVAVLAAVGAFLVILVALLALVPAVIVGGIIGVVVALAASPFAGVVVVAAFGGVAFTVVALAGFALLEVFLRYYALFVLARVDGDLDFLPERRRAVGAGDPDSGDADNSDAVGDVSSDPDDTPDRDPGRDDPQLDPL